ncbi:glutamine--fructose-6-phosphate transaminase (isomerizing) [Spectribacter hydrogenoxidans]|uniref:Glutamine--fructose-6-phosphate aminotransferase [isomerizing] n=1 Tax=Spectribacter hydrogenoxidans TaxID=3075608 RepID=A0ABU3C008_9GAMM|nr:glutamine--fructose-6-phosphate transaminase (isomerizing) [Salinisphaera sp. W335]MDT0634868.1 glutamine--fructose-6-phosphate transaminase (isomerizing) [Salinisphaera sp. W335]
MCGIVGAAARRDVVPVLIEGLRRLEYRGYDSAGLAVIDEHSRLVSARAVGKVAALADRLDAEPFAGQVGAAHTRWATHGGVSEANAHPQRSGDNVAVVHNGIIENYESLREVLEGKGYGFHSQTDTEVIAHLIDSHLQTGLGLREAVRTSLGELDGAYAIVAVTPDEPTRLVAARRGSPLVLGVGNGEHFVASDAAALLPVTRHFVFLEEGDLVDLTADSAEVIDLQGTTVTRPVVESSLSADAADKGGYRHYMLKEIFEQPKALGDTLSERFAHGRPLEAVLGPDAAELLPQVRGVHIVACGTSYHAGLVARYYLEQGGGVPCTVEVASEYRYRDPVVPPGTLFLAISQSGETADTLAALRFARGSGYVATAAICNVPESSLVRESDLVLMTRAGPEIGVASTKAFTTQLAALGLFGMLVARHNRLDARMEKLYARQLLHVPAQVEKTLQLESAMIKWAEWFADKHHALFLGRGPSFPVALEGALKLKEISYIHAEAYPAGELKHGPLALVDADMPVVAVAPNNRLIEKLKSNLQEVRARGGQLFVLADPDTGIRSEPGIEVVTMPEHIEALQAPLVYTVPLQLLAYHVAVARGTDVDQPRNLAKSVTVE